MLSKLLTASLLLFLSACAAIVPSEHLISKDSLESNVQKQFPLRHDKGGGLLSLTIDPPQLVLNQKLNRIGLNGQLTARAPLVEIKGSFSCSAKLYYKASESAVYLYDVNLDDLKTNTGNSYVSMLKPEINRLLNNYAVNHPVYRFRAEDLKILSLKVDVEKINVKNDGILLKLKTVN
jgi:hypothetical protein